MKYNTSKAIGDAGEHLLGFLIPYLHKCIYRISNIDIGIDGEIEIIENGCSTGNFIKVQVKTTDTEYFSKNKILYQINEAHIEYWKQLSIPVLLCRVFLKSQKVYCLPINDNLKIIQTSTKGKINIDFSDSFEILDKDFINYLKKYATSKNKETVKMIESKLDIISQKVSNIPDYRSPLLHIPSIDYIGMILDILDELSSIEKTIEMFNLNETKPEYCDKIQNYYNKLNRSLKELRIISVTN